MQNKLDQAHDRFAVEMLSDEEVTRELIAKHVPHEITQFLDLDNLVVRSESYTDELERAFTDVVVKLRLKDRPENEAEIYILIEHKSRPEKFARLQILKYKLRKWLEALKAKEKPDYLPIIISMVFTHGEGRWHYSTDFSDLFDCPSDYFRQFIPQFRHLIHDLNVIDDEQIREQTLLNVVQLAMKFIHSKELKKRIVDIYAMLASIEDPEKRMMATILVTRYIIGASGYVKMNDLIPLIPKADKKEGIVQTIEDQIRADERFFALQDGEKIGEQKGELKAARTMILNQSAAKFDYVPVGFSQKINAIEDMATLNSLSLGLLKSDTLEAFQALVDKATKSTTH